MARLKLLSARDLPEQDQDVLERPINLYRVLAHVPELARRYRAMGRWIRFESSLDPRLRELVILQVGVATGNAYEASHHVRIGREQGLTDHDVRAVVAETRGEATDLGELERTALQAARELTLHARLDDRTWRKLGRWLNDGQRLELSTVVAYYNMTVRIIEAVQLDVEDDYVGYLEQLPGLAGPAGAALD
jgi:alkylhydroperoxidase family enzyme